MSKKNLRDAVVAMRRLVPSVQVAMENALLAFAYIIKDKHNAFPGKDRAREPVRSHIKSYEEQAKEILFFVAEANISTGAAAKITRLLML